MFLYLILLAIIMVAMGVIGHRAGVKAFTVSEENGLSVNRLADGKRSNKLIVIFGFGGSEKKHFRRINEFYAEQGHSSIVFTGSMGMFWEQGTSYQCLAPFLDAVHTYISTLSRPEQQNLQIIPHIYSNTGFYLFATFLYFLKSPTPAKINDNSPNFQYLINKLDVTMWDSAPLLLPFQRTVKPTNEWLDKIRDAALAEHLLQPTTQNDALPEPAVLDQSTIVIDYDCNHIDNPLVMLSQTLGVVPAVVSMVLKKNTYIHPFWTPALTIAMMYVFIRNAILRAIRRMDAEKKQIPKEKIECIPLFYASCWNGYGKQYFTAPLPKDDISTTLPIFDTTKVERKMAYVHFDMDELIPFEFLIDSFVLEPSPQYGMCKQQLLVYSKKDILIPPADIERTMWFFQHSGSKVYQLKLQQAPHVAGFLKEPEKYSATLKQFLNNIVEKKGGVESVDTSSAIAKKVD